MAKHERKNQAKHPPMYYIAAALMILGVCGILFFAGRQLIPYFRAKQLQNNIPKPAFSAAVRQPVTFSVLSASAVASPVPETEEAAAEPQTEEEKQAQAEDTEEEVSTPLTPKERAHVKEAMKEAEKAFEKETEEFVFAEEDAPVSEEFKELLEINPDTVGWLTVGEIADYPVVKRDDEYYLTHNFEGKYDPNGTIFVTQNNVLRPRDTVLLMYGHHMSSGQMFGRLVRYMHEDYMREFPLIQFRTIYADEEEHDTWYVPVSFFSASMEEGEEGYFDILPMFFENEKDHDEYLKTIRERSVWKAPTDVTKEDNLIMLITCSYDLVDSRYLLICRQLREDETPEQMEALYQNIEP